MKPKLTIKIDKNQPLPKDKWVDDSMIGAYRKALCSMNQGDSFIVNDETAYKLAYRAARQVLITIKTRKVNGQGFRIWRSK